MSARWSSRSVGSRLQHAIFYALIRFAGTTGAYALLAIVVSWYTLRPSVRNRSKAYLGRRFPAAGFWAMLLHTWKLQWTFGQCLVDRAAAGISGGFSFAENFRDRLSFAAEEGRGVILLAGHTGCWQLSPTALAEHAGTRVTVLAHTEDGDVDRHAHEHAGTRPPYETLYSREGVGTSVALLNRLREGELLCIMGDRVEGDAEPAVTVSFFGSPVAMPCAAYRLASASGAPLVFTFAVRTGAMQGTLRIAEVLRIPAGLGKNPENYQPYAQRFASELERFTREYPYQFFNFYDLWG